MIGRALNYDPGCLNYQGIIGTGGIGSGKFFVLNGNSTLGREESRSGHFLNVTDYCKQHIILHYIKALLGQSFEVIPVGCVGDDDMGRILYNEMAETGFDMDLVEKLPGISTLFSFCFYYPDGSGGNLTTDNSASARVDQAYIEKAIPKAEKFGSKGIVLAVPEVPLGARHKLLETGKNNGLFCSASFTSEEIVTALKEGMMRNTDLIAINFDEASAMTGKRMDRTDIKSVIRSAIQILFENNNDILVSVTAGKEGSWTWDGKVLNFLPAIKTHAVSTAGAGDAFFSGILTGHAIGFHLFEAQHLATLIAGLSVTSPDTIHKGIDRCSLYRFMCTSGIKFSDAINRLLED
jgi:ribokinase